MQEKEHGRIDEGVSEANVQSHLLDYFNYGLRLIGVFSEVALKFETIEMVISYRYWKFIKEVTRSWANDSLFP